jgi:hypothetical protein
MMNTNEFTVIKIKKDVTDNKYIIQGLHGNISHHGRYGYHRHHEHHKRPSLTSQTPRTLQKSIAVITTIGAIVNITDIMNITLCTIRLSKPSETSPSQDNHGHTHIMDKPGTSIMDITDIKDITVLRPSHTSERPKLNLFLFVTKNLKAI